MMRQCGLNFGEIESCGVREGRAGGKWVQVGVDTASSPSWKRQAWRKVRRQDFCQRWKQYKLRRRLAECRGICEKGDDDSRSALALVPAAKRGNLLGLDLGVKLDAAKLRQLWVDFLTTRIRVNYWSATADQPSSLCNRFMGKSAPRCCASFLGSSSSPHGTPGTGTKEKTFVSLLAEASGQQDALDWSGARRHLSLLSRKL